MKKYLLWLAIIGFAVTAVANEFYTPTGTPQPNTLASSAAMRAEFQRIEDGFDKLPTMAGNGDLPIFVNTAESQLVAVSISSGRAKLGLVIGQDVQPYDANLITWPSTIDATEVDYLNGVTSNIQDQIDAAAVNSADALPNLLINSDFVVNQEGYAADGVAALAGDEYAHDMWKVTSGAGTVIYQKNSVGDVIIDMITSTSATEYGLYQKNDDLVNTNGETLTLSLYVVSLSSGLNVSGGGLASQAISSTGWHSFTFTSNGTGEFQLSATFTPPGTVYPNFRFNSVKIERGSTRTPYVKPEPRSERLRCEHYLRFLRAAGTETLYQGVARFEDNWTKAIWFPFSQPMRTVHTVTFNDLYFVGSGGNTWQTLVWDSIGGQSDYGIELILTHSLSTAYAGTYYIKGIGATLKIDARY